MDTPNQIKAEKAHVAVTSITSNSRVLRADGSWHDDAWRRVATVAEVPAPDQTSADQAIIVPLEALNADAQRWSQQAHLGVWVDGHAEPQSVQAWVSRLALIEIYIPIFRDGRCYSLAALLRTRYGFQGELRASGDVLVDQLFYLKRVGFSSFVLRPDQAPADAERSLRTFSDGYQASVEQPIPAFRRVPERLNVVVAARQP